jgi:hypothetical protein
MASVMAVLVFGLLFLLFLFSLAISTLMPWLILIAILFGAVKIGLVLKRHSKYSKFAILLPALSVVFPAAWGMASYTSFISACEKSNGAEIYKKSDAPQEGFLLDAKELESWPFYKTVNSPGMLFNAGKIKYYDMYFNNSRNNFKREIYRNSDSRSNLAQPPSEFVFKVMPIERSNSYLLAPIYRVSYEVQRMNSPVVLARGSEYVFGGGLIGMYLKAFFGKNFTSDREEYNYLACGYAAKSPIAWRPTSIQFEDSDLYVKADLDLLKTIIE